MTGPTAAFHLSDARAAHWLEGSPMDPVATPTEHLPTVPGFPFLYAGAGAVIHGPTGGGRSMLAQACLYDAAKGGRRCLYLGHEITEDEFNARARVLAECRGDDVDDGELREQLGRVRYLNLGTVIVQAWADRERWRVDVVERFDVIVIDPVSAAESALAMDFESNPEWIRFYDALIQPLTDRGVTVALIDNIGHAKEARRRAKGASAKEDRADLTFSCGPSANPVGVIVKACKVRSARAPHQRGDEWLCRKDTQVVERLTPRAGKDPERSMGFRPTKLMQQVSELIEQNAGLSSRSIRAGVSGRAEYVDLARELLITEGYLAVDDAADTHHHRSVRAFRERAETDRVPTVSHRVPDTVRAPVSHRVPGTTYPDAPDTDAVAGSTAGCVPDTAGADRANGNADGAAECQPSQCGPLDVESDTCVGADTYREIRPLTGQQRAILAEHAGNHSDLAETAKAATVLEQTRQRYGVAP
jgi:hypothetical protein